MREPTSLLGRSPCQPLLGARFWRKVRRSPEGCWLWTGALSDGYPMYWFQGRVVAGHRLAYQVYVGSVPNGHELDHVCQTRPCVHPLHLRPIPHRQNTLRRFTDLTQCRHGHAYTVDNLIFQQRAGGGLNRRCAECRRQAAAGSAERRAQRRATLQAWATLDRVLGVRRTPDGSVIHPISAS